jgi:uncharacterized protein YutD
MLYFSEIFNEIKEFYVNDNFNGIFQDSLNKLDYVVDILVFEGMKKQLMKASLKRAKAKNPNIIDVDLVEE